jgi:uncharacterized protein
MRKVACPQCGIFIEYDTNNPFRPFCCERCKMLDLGSWADESYRLSDNSTPIDSVSESTKLQHPHN